MSRDSGYAYAMELSAPRDFTVTFAVGLGALVRGDVQAYGGSTASENAGAMSFTGTLETAYRLCLWSRYASRILMPLGPSFPAKDGTALRQAAYGLPWELHFGPEETISIECAARASTVTNTHYAALCIKDGIADRFIKGCGRRPSVDIKQPDIRVHLYLREDRGILSLDLSGEALHRRGYRTSPGEAPLKESLAAGIVALSGAYTGGTSPGAVIDPMCGSGTLLLEAALMWGNVAPGLFRNSYGFTKWRMHDQALWKRLVHEALERKKATLPRPFPRFIGYDASRKSVAEARENVLRAGLSGLVHMERRDLAFLSPPPGPEPKTGLESNLIVVNPPYGERLGDPTALPYLYRCLGRKLREGFPGWTVGVFTATDAPSDALGMAPDERYRLFNGAIPCALQVFRIPSAPPAKSSTKLQASPVPCGKARGEFADRLRKNLRVRSKWAHREAITCYRIYDADLPQYNAAIDLYEDLVHIREYRPPAAVPPEIAAERIHEIVAAVRDVVGVQRDHLFIARTPTPGKRVPPKKERERPYEVGEDNHRFLVDLSGAKGTGLPLEQRNLRRMIRKESAGRRFLNLFCGSGAATVHAAMGGARSTVSVDDSQAWIHRARKNMFLNGLSEENHRLVVGHPFEWLPTARERFDLIFSDVTGRFPSAGHRADALHDGTDLLLACTGKLERGGIMILLSRDRRFRLDEAAFHGLQIQEITRTTIPPDFERTPRIHRAWRILRTHTLSR